MKAYLVKTEDNAVVVAHHSKDGAIQLAISKGIAAILAYKINDITVNLSITEPCIIDLS